MILAASCSCIQTRTWDSPLPLLSWTSHSRLYHRAFQLSQELFQLEWILEKTLGERPGDHLELWTAPLDPQQDVSPPGGGRLGPDIKGPVRLVL